MFSELSHHAYAVVGNREEVLPKLLDALGGCGIALRGNPDLRIEHFLLFGIDEARTLVQMAQRQGISGGKKIFLIVMEKMTNESQNALLKLFEEPTPDTHLFLIVPTMEMLLPTLRSRLHLVTPIRGRHKEKREHATEFLRVTPAARLKIVQIFLKDLDNEKECARERILAFLDELEGAAGGGGGPGAPPER